jgi:hypothetical protein
MSLLLNNIGRDQKLFPVPLSSANPNQKQEIVPVPEIGIHNTDKSTAIFISIPDPNNFPGAPDKHVDLVLKK